MLGAVVAFLGLLGSAVWAVGFSTWFSTSSVSVAGTDILSHSQVRQAAAVPLGHPLVRQDLDRIAGDVAQLRPVRTARVERRWPHTVAVRVTERTPAVAVGQPDGLLLIDVEGVGFHTVRKLPAGVQRAEVNPGNRRVVVAVAAVATDLPPSFRGRVKRLSARSPSGITVVMKSGVEVSWGDATESALKAEITLALLKQHPRAINVSAPHNPATS